MAVDTWRESTLGNGQAVTDEGRGRSERVQGPDVRDVVPVLSFSSCRITFHLLIQDECEREVAGDRRGLPAAHDEVLTAASTTVNPTTVNQGRFDQAIDSYERDMLAYAYRDWNRRPFRTHLIGKSRWLTAVFPPLLRFISEDTEVHLRAPERRVHFEVSACVTTFDPSRTTDPAKQSVTVRPRSLSITLSPAPGFAVNEYELLRLAKLWEGGELLTQPVAFQAEGLPSSDWPTHLTDPNDSKLDGCRRELLSKLADWVGQSTPTQEVFCVGTLDLLEEQQSVHRLVASVSKLLECPDCYSGVVGLGERVTGEGLGESPERSRVLAGEWQRLVAFGGLVQGLLDFEEIGVDELRDVYAAVMGGERAKPSEGRPHALTAVHKGTLLSVAPDTERSRSWKTRVNPYLAIPHAVALYNEERMLRAKESARAAVQGPRSFWGSYPPMNQARQRLAEADEQLEEFVPNVFVYPSERYVYESCHRNRAIADLRSQAKEQLEISRNRVDYREKKHGAAFAIIALTLGVIASAEGYFIKTKELVTDPLVALVAVGLLPLLVYAGFYLWRRHH